MNFIISSLKNVGVLIGRALYLRIVFGSMAFLTVLILLIQKHRIAFHFFNFPLEFSEERSLTLWFSPKYFILIDITLTRILFLLLSDIL